jgi:hypothetical protein
MRGDLLGVMGSSGQSEAPHLHLDVVVGMQSNAYSLASIDNGCPAPAPVRQLLYFADSDLFGVPLIVTTPYAEVEYFTKRGKVHYGLDLVPFDRKETADHRSIYWNRTFHGRVIRIGFDPEGYGHHIQISYEAP